MKFNSLYVILEGNGYDGYSMSWNARKARREGKLPVSDMVKYLKTRWPKSFKSLTNDILKTSVDASEWHHTSKYYNKTDFYDKVEVLSNRKDIFDEINKRKRYKELIKKAKELHIETVTLPDRRKESINDMERHQNENERSLFHVSSEFWDELEKQINSHNLL